MNTCPMCTEDVEPGVATCPHCGHPLTTPAANVAPTPARVAATAGDRARASLRTYAIPGVLLVTIVIAVVVKLAVSATAGAPLDLSPLGPPRDTEWRCTSSHETSYCSAEGGLSCERFAAALFGELEGQRRNPSQTDCTSQAEAFCFSYRGADNHRHSSCKATEAHCAEDQERHRSGTAERATESSACYRVRVVDGRYASVGVASTSRTPSAPAPSGRAVPVAAFERVCIEDHILPACAAAGMFLLDGRAGVRDAQRGVRLLEQSCSAGFGPGCAHLAAAYCAGVGGTRDPARANDSFRRACAAGIQIGCGANCEAPVTVAPAPVAPVAPVPAPVTDMPQAPMPPRREALSPVSPVAVTASSFISNGRRQHAPERAFDDDPATAWNESARGPGDGQWLQAEFATPRRVQRVRLATGWDFISDRDGDLFAANSHLRRVRLVFDDGRSVTRDVDVDARIVTFEGLDATTRTVRIVADAVWPGERWADLCISDVVILGE